MAYAAFADNPVDVGIVEVGMGGQWDATNIATGQVAVITTITRDHEKWLGNSLTDIAKEKDRKSTRLNSSHVAISYDVFCLKKKTKIKHTKKSTSELNNSE